MPEPDPQPPPQRGVSFGRWLLLLVPSAPFFFADPVAEAWARAYDVRADPILLILASWLIAFAIAAVLSAVFGVQMEKWKRGAVESIPRVIVYALNILFTAGFVGLGGSALMSKYFTP